MTFVRTQKVQVQRPCPPKFDKATGRYVETYTDSFEIRANIQPTSGEDLLKLPEGRRATESLRCYTRTEIKVKDIVLFEGKKYEIFHIDDWNQRSSTIPHFKGVMIRC